MSIMNKIGPKILPCGTPVVNSNGLEYTRQADSDLKHIFGDVLLKYVVPKPLQTKHIPLIPNLSSLASNISCCIVSKAFVRSTNNPRNFIFLIYVETNKTST